MKKLLIILLILSVGCSASKPLTKNIEVGMTKETVLTILGKPKYKFNMITEKGNFKHWYYGRLLQNNHKEIVFNNGVVESFKIYERFYEFKKDTGLYN